MTTELEKRIETLEAALAKAEEEKKTALGEKFKAANALKKAVEDTEAAIEDAKAETGTELDKARNEVKKLTKQVADLSGERDTYASELRTTRVDNEIKSAITSGKVMPEWAELVESHLLRRVTYEDGVATIEGKSIADAAKAYLKTPTGLKTVRAPESSGSGSTGASTVDTSGWKDAPQTAEEFNRYMKLTVDDPAAATALAQQWNREDLKP